LLIPQLCSRALSVDGSSSKLFSVPGIQLDGFRIALLQQLVLDVMQYRRYLQLRHGLLLAVVRYLNRTHDLSLVVDVKAPHPQPPQLGCLVAR